eukprot:1181451-Prorocentrum_minimum.AAC.2
MREQAGTTDVHGGEARTFGSLLSRGALSGSACSSRYPALIARSTYKALSPEHEYGVSSSCPPLAYLTTGGRNLAGKTLLVGFCLNGEAPWDIFLQRQEADGGRVRDVQRLRSRHCQTLHLGRACVNRENRVPSRTARRNPEGVWITLERPP